MAPSPTAYPYSAVLGSSPVSFAQASLLGRLSSVATQSGTGSNTKWQLERYSYHTTLGQVAATRIDTEAMSPYYDLINDVFWTSGRLRARYVYRQNGTATVGAPAMYSYIPTARGTLERIFATGTSAWGDPVWYTYNAAGQMTSMQTPGMAQAIPLSCPLIHSRPRISV